MARIRTIKPEFWTDEKIVQLPYEARLLYIGIWNFADDEGYLLDEPERIRMQVLPAEDIDAEMLIDLLVAAGFLDRIELNDGVFALQIVHFVEHQKVSNPTKSKIAPKYSRKLCIPLSARRGLAMKYGVKPGGSGTAECYYCGYIGRIYWPMTSRGVPGCWVCFGGLEIDHFIPESSGGAKTCDNLVLACRRCNRGKKDIHPFEFLDKSSSENLHEDSRTFANSLESSLRNGNGIGMEMEGKNTDSSVVQDQEVVLLTYPCNGKPNQWTLKQSIVDEWASIYPTVDILAESKKALAWVKANGLKTARGMPRFLVGWFGRCNDRATRPTPGRRQLGQVDLDEMTRKADAIVQQHKREREEAGR